MYGADFMRNNPFKGHRFPSEIILWAVRWYCRYAISYRDLQDMLEERGCALMLLPFVVGCRSLHQKSQNGLSNTEVGGA